MKKNNIYFSLSDISTIVNISRKIDSLTANIQHDREKDNDISFQSNSTNEYENTKSAFRKWNMALFLYKINSPIRYY